MLASTLRIHIFSPLCSVINREQHEKHLCNQTSHYGKYGMHDCQSTHPSYWYKSGCVTLAWCISTLCFASSSSNIWLPFQAKNNVRSAPCLQCIYVSLTPSHNARTTNRHLHGKGERNGVQRKQSKLWYDASIGAAAVGKKAHLRMKRRWTVKKSRL